MQNCSAKKLNKPFATGADLNPQVEFSNSALFLEWAAKTFPAVKLAKIENFCSGHHYELQGPTGESNQYMVIPRHAILSLAEQEADQLQQLNAIFAVGSRPAVLADNSFVLKHIPSMPKALAQAFHVIKDIKTGCF